MGYGSGAVSGALPQWIFSHYGGAFDKAAALAEEDSEVDEESEEELEDAWQPLLLPLAAGQASGRSDAQITQLFSSALDVFKGILVLLMSWAHTDLALMSPAGLSGTLPHLVGNAAASLCFLGFMLAYGFSCDMAYLSERKPREPAERMRRVLRSVFMPVLGAWVCAFAWGWMCFKLPLDLRTALQLLTFRLTLGNGPDFLLCFSFSLLCAYPLRNALNWALGRNRGWRPRSACVAVMLLIPLASTYFVLQDCTGLKKYLAYALECTILEPFSPALPALPHFFYFSLGVLLSRLMQSLGSPWKISDIRLAGGFGLALGVVSVLLTYPLACAWGHHYGNVSVLTPYGRITRGFSHGPSALWLLGNIFPVFALLAGSVAFQNFVDGRGGAIGPGAEARPCQSCFFWLAAWVRNELAQMGANVLLYLVVVDVCLAGLYRGSATGGPEALPACGAFLMTIALLAIVRIVQWLSAAPVRSAAPAR